MVLDWDGEEPSVGAVLGAIVWTKQVWLASIEGHDQPDAPACEFGAPQLGRRPRRRRRALDARWWPSTPQQGRLGDTVIDALCDPPESFQLYGIVAHVLTYSAHRRELARAHAGPPRGARPAPATHWTG